MLSAGRKTRGRGRLTATALALVAPLVVAVCTGVTPQLPASAPPPPSPDGPGTGPHAAEAARFARHANEHRRLQGCRPITWHAEAAAVALRHSEDMSRRAYFSHVNPDGHSPFDRLRRASIGFTAAAENIAFGQHSARHVLRSWIDSPGHRVSLENCNYTHHGVGFDGRNWTHILLRP